MCTRGLETDNLTLRLTAKQNIIWKKNTKSQIETGPEQNMKESVTMLDMLVVLL